MRKSNEHSLTWMADGNCANQPPSLFFPSDGVGVDVARGVCDGCPVLSECLEYALENRIDHGVWGGTSERERRRIQKARASVKNETTVILHSAPTSTSVNNTRVTVGV